jgi:hypothetical protein
VGVLLVALSAALSCNFDPALACPPQARTANEIPPNLHITVLQGEDGVNILKRKMAVKPVVEVRDKNNLPVAYASVTFTAPESGPSVAFAHGSHIFMTTTDANGRAVVANMKPVGTGSFKISVTASFHGQSATAAIAQTNYLTVAAAGAAGAGAGAGAATAAAGISATTIGIIAAGAAVAVGVAVAVSKGGASKTTGTIGSGGSPVIGPPH